jgi:hypothetical protein
MTRLSLQVFYLWRHVSSTATPFILWWSNLEILFGPLHRSSPFRGELRCQAIQMEHGPYIAERTQNAVYIVRCLWFRPKVRCQVLKIEKKLICSVWIAPSWGFSRLLGQILDSEGCVVVVLQSLGRMGHWTSVQYSMCRFCWFCCLSTAVEGKDFYRFLIFSNLNLNIKNSGAK